MAVPDVACPPSGNAGSIGARFPRATARSFPGVTVRQAPSQGAQFPRGVLVSGGPS